MELDTVCDMVRSYSQLEIRSRKGEHVEWTALASKHTQTDLDDFITAPEADKIDVDI